MTQSGGPRKFQVSPVPQERFVGWKIPFAPTKGDPGPGLGPEARGPGFGQRPRGPACRGKVCSRPVDDEGSASPSIKRHRREAEPEETTPEARGTCAGVEHAPKPVDVCAFVPDAVAAEPPLPAAAPRETPAPEGALGSSPFLVKCIPLPP